MGPRTIVFSFKVYMKYVMCLDISNILVGHYLCGDSRTGA